MNISDLAKHVRIMEHARSVAGKILKDDPMLEKEQDQALKRRIVKLFGRNIQLEL